MPEACSREGGCPERTETDPLATFLSLAWLSQHLSELMAKWETRELRPRSSKKRKTFASTWN